MPPCRKPSTASPASSSPTSTAAPPPHPPKRYLVEALDAAGPLTNTILEHNANVARLAEAQAALESDAMSLAASMATADGATIAARAQELRVAAFDLARGRLGLCLRMARLAADVAGHLERTDLAAAEAELAKLRADAVAGLAALGITPETQLHEHAASDAKQAAFNRIVDQTPNVRAAIARVDELKTRIVRFRDEAREARRPEADSAHAHLAKAWQLLVGPILP